MESAGRKNRIVLLFSGVAGAALLYSAWRMFGTGAFPWQLAQKEYRQMAAETAVVFLLLLFFLVSVKNPLGKWAGVLAVLAVFTWAHAVFLPMVVSGGYLLYLIAGGRFLRTKVLKLPKRDGVAYDFLTGSMAVVLIFCLMSAAGAGSIPMLTAFVAGTAVFLAAGEGVCAFRKRTLSRGGAAFAPSPISRISPYTGLCLAFILTAFCIQAGRMNIAPDFDSLWYGLRAPYILDNGRGIYENLGTIGVVYTYSKGFEVLTLPLSALPSYSFLLAFQLWLLSGCLLAAYRIARFYMEKKQALFLTALLAAVPGITNMAVTAKTDMATLLFQLIMIGGLLAYLKEGKNSWRHLAFGIGAFLFSWTLKPTALVFSTAIMGMSVLFLLWKRLLPSGGFKSEERGSLGILFLSLASLTGIWARTVMITGLPVTSVFSSLLTKLGFTMKYPYNVSHIPNSGADIPLSQWISGSAKRIADFFLSPLGEDMEHVVLAWGGFILLVFFILWAALTISRQERERKIPRRSLVSSYLTVVYVPFLLVNVASLVMLTQVDGNYFMLLYVLTGIFVFRLLGERKDPSLERDVRRCLLPVMAYLTVVTTVTSWSWCVGFTPISWRHSGFEDHMEAEQKEMAQKGNAKIWEILKEDPRTRLIAVGDHPQVLSFPCSVQSYDDITGSWGNVVLVKKMDYFVDFMGYAGTDYIYAQAGYMDEEERCYTLVRDLIEYGKLVPVLYEEGNLLARVDVDGEYTEISRAALTEFQNCYIKGNDISTEGR